MLATIKTDVALEQSLEELQLGPIDKEALLAVYREYELRNLIKELESGGAEESEAESDEEGAAPAAAIETDYRCILDEAEFDAGWHGCRRRRCLPSTPRPPVSTMEARVVGVSFAIEPGKAAYVPFGHDYLGSACPAERSLVLGKLKPLLEDPARLKVGQNLHDRNVLLQPRHRAAGYRLRHHARNPMCSTPPPAATTWIPLALQVSERRNHLVRRDRRQGVKQLTFNQGSNWSRRPLRGGRCRHWPPASASDAVGQALCRTGSRQGVQRDRTALLPVLARMERLGTTIEPKLLHQQSQEDRSASGRAGEAGPRAGRAGVQSLLAQAAGEILFTKLGLPIIKRPPRERHPLRKRCWPSWRRPMSCRNC